MSKHNNFKPNKFQIRTIKFHISESIDDDMNELCIEIDGYLQAIDNLMQGINTNKKVCSDRSDIVVLDDFAFAKSLMITTIALNIEKIIQKLKIGAEEILLRKKIENYRVAIKIVKEKTRNGKLCLLLEEVKIEQK